MKEPTAEEITAARAASGLSRADAAAVIFKSVRSWEKWEVGERPMDPAFFELFKIKTGLAAAPSAPKKRKAKRKTAR